jgi:hypothetical protein
LEKAKDIFVIPIKLAPELRLSWLGEATDLGDTPAVGEVPLKSAGRKSRANASGIMKSPNRSARAGWGEVYLAQDTRLDRPPLPR